MRSWVDGLGKVFAVFDLQDSGCVSYGVQEDSGRRLFVKTSTTPAAVTSMRRGLVLHAAVSHPTIVAPLEAHELDSGNIAIVFPWRDGEVLYPTTPQRSVVRTDPSGPLVRFRSLPVPVILDAIDAILDAHLAITAAGFVEVDLYDGCFLYDFDKRVMRLVDLDEYRPGPFIVDADRLPGSTRFMAPEQWLRGATIDERSTVHVLGRAMRLLLDAGDDEAQWRGTAAQLDIIATATDPDPSRRFNSVERLANAWRALSK